MYCCFSPLVNFNSSEPKIRVTSNLLIDRPTAAEAKVVRTCHSFGSPELLGKWKFVIRCNYKKAADSWLSESTVHKTVKCLRLFKNDLVGCGQVYTFDRLRSVCLGESDFDTCNDVLYRPVGTYELQKEELPAFLKFLNFDLEKHLRMGMAVERFDKTYEEGLRDIPIDIMIGLEALYLADTQELAYKMAMRAAHLLGSTDEQHQSIFAAIKKAYDIRSKLVHGIWAFADPIKSKTKFENQLNTLASANDILRESIKKFIDLLSVYSHDQLLKDILDNNILSRELKL
jgi:hypothetical protein